jgi:PEGA domain
LAILHKWLGKQAAIYAVIMRLPTIALPAALLTALTLVSVPASAGQRDRHDGNRSASSGNESRGRTEERAQPRAQQAAPAQPRAQQTAPAQPRAQESAPTPRGAAAPSRSQETQRNFQRNDGQRFQGQRNGAPLGDVRRDNVAPGPNVVRPSVAPRYEPRYQPHYDSHYAPRYESRYYGSRSYVRPYQFRPRFSIGFGIFAGYPVPYSYYAYPYPVPVYGYSTPREVIVGADSNAYGGITFEMTPYEADIYVDGTFAGHVSDFDGTRQPLTLTAGTHQIEVAAQGYQTLSFDVSVQPGQVIPYRGDLQR